MTTMEKIPGVVIDIVFAFFGITNLLTIGADYRHILAGFSGSLFVTTFLNKGGKDKLWFASGGFSFACFVGPAICEYYNCDSHSSTCIAIYFASGTSGMLIVQMLVTFLNQSNNNLPQLVTTAFSGLKAYISRRMDNNNTKNNNDDVENVN